MGAVEVVEDRLHQGAELAHDPLGLLALTDALPGFVEDGLGDPGQGDRLHLGQGAGQAGGRVREDVRDRVGEAVGGLEAQPADRSVRAILGYATASGAQTLGLGDRTGSLTPGKQADLVLLRADRPDVAPIYDPYSTVVLQMDRSHVDTVLVAGVAVHRGSKPVTDSSDLVRQAAAVSRRLVSAGLVPAGALAA